jgi:hypothetical protein
MPWTTSLDLGIAYTPSFLSQQLRASVDVFNVFNQQKVQSYVESSDANRAGALLHEDSELQPAAFRALPAEIRFQVATLSRSVTLKTPARKCRRLFFVRPAGRTHLEVQVLYTPGMGKC